MGSKKNNIYWFGVGLIIVGALNYVNFGFVSRIIEDLLPLAAIGVGIYLVIKNK